MNYEVIISENFKKEFKILYKRYPSLKSDIQNVLNNIEKELQLAVDLGGGFKKIRLKITSKGKGKSGGGRIITHETILEVNEKTIVFGSIYDKSQYTNIDTELLRKLLNL